MSFNDYNKEFTESSFIELKKFLKWMNDKKGIIPIIIGGWAVYAYNPVIGSKDIDVVVPTSRDIEKNLLEEYFLANNFKVKKDMYFNPKYYYKEIVADGITKEIIFDVFIGESMKEDEENLGITLNWKTTLENQEERQIEDLSLYVPQRELLIVLKIIAALERSAKYDKQADVQISSKIWKDYHDIAALVAGQTLKTESLRKYMRETNITRHIDNFLMKYGQKEYGETLAKFGIDYKEIEALLKF